MPDPWQQDVLDDWLARRRGGRWAAATCALAVPRQNGKNGIIEVRELFGMVALGERFLHTAHEVKTARKAFLRIAGFFENERKHPELAALVKDIRKTNGQEAVILTNGGSVEFIARSKGSGRGFTVDVLVCDEAQELTDEELAALLPTISASPQGNPQVILTGTPPDPEKPRQGEVFRRVRSDGQARRDPRLAWTDYGVPDGPLPDVDDRRLWTAANPTLGIRLNVAEIERERGLMSPETFARERLGWWGDPAVASGGVFGAGFWEACAVDSETVPTVEAIGVAVSIDRAFGSLGAAGRTGERMLLGAVDRRPGTSWLVGEVARIHKAHGCTVVIDGRGPAADLVEGLRAEGVEPLITSTADYLDACAGLYDAVREAKVGHPRHPDLDAAVAGAATRNVGDRWAWARKSSSGDVSMLEAVTLAAWGAAQAPAYDVLDSIY